MALLIGLGAALGVQVDAASASMALELSRQTALVPAATAATPIGGYNFGLTSPFTELNGVQPDFAQLGIYESIDGVSPAGLLDLGYGTGAETQWEPFNPAEGPPNEISGNEVSLTLKYAAGSSCPAGQHALPYVVLQGSLSANGDELSGTYSAGKYQQEVVPPATQCSARIISSGEESGPWTATRIGTVSSQPKLSIGGATAFEPASGTGTVGLPVTLSAASSHAVSVEYTTRDGTGSTAATAPRDYQATTGTLTFSPGETSKTIPVTINHSEFSGKRMFSVTLSNAQEAEIAVAEATGTISALRKSDTTLQCAEAGPGPLTCTATVSDTTGNTMFVNPTGEVSFVATAGSFSSASCALKPGATPDAAACQVMFAPPSPGKAPIKITASYPGDSVYEASSGSSGLCADGRLLELGSITTTAPHANGFELHSPVVLHGCGFNAGMIVKEWGAGVPGSNENTPTIDAEATEATMFVPWNATSGDVVVSVGSNTAKLAAQQVDSWRNTEGLIFPNYGAPINAREFVSAFAGTKVAESTTSFGKPRILGEYQELFEAHPDAGGLCYGFGYLSATFADGTGKLAEFPGGATLPYMLSRGPLVEEALKSGWLRQFSTEADLYLFRRTLNTGGADIRAQLEAAFGGDGYHKPALVAINWYTKGPKGETNGDAHAITAFGIRDTENAGEFEIETANSNAPFAAAEDTNAEQHQAALTKSAVKVQPDGEWTFPEFEATGGPTEISVMPIAAIEGPLHLSGPATTNTFGPSTRVATVSDPTTGKPVDLTGGGSPGIAVNPFIDAIQATTAGGSLGVGGIQSVDGPSGRWAETVDDTKGPVSDSFRGPNGSGWLKATAGTDRVVFDSSKDSLALAPVAGQAASKSGTLTLISKTGGTGERILKVTGPVVSADASFALTASRASLGVGTGGSFDVALAIEGGGSAWQTYDAGKIRLGAGQALTLTPANWRHLAAGRISATLRSRHGKHALHLHNRFKAPAARVLTSTVARAGKTAKLHVTLATPPLSVEAGVEVIVAVHHAGHVLTHAHAAVQIGSARHVSVTLALAKEIPAAATVSFTVITEVGGTAPSTARTKRTLTLP